MSGRTRFVCSRVIREMGGPLARSSEGPGEMDRWATRDHTDRHRQTHKKQRHRSGEEGRSPLSCLQAESSYPFWEETEASTGLTDATRPTGGWRTTQCQVPSLLAGADQWTMD